MIIYHQILMLGFKEWEEEIILLFRIQFGKEVSEVDMLRTVVLEELISSLLEMIHTLM